MHYIGELNPDIYRCVCDTILTTEVVITDERIAHIKQRHPNNYERFHMLMKEIVEDPDYIIEDSRPHTAIVLKEFVLPETETYIRIALRLVTSKDNERMKNSILTFMKIRRKEYERLVRNKKILYSRK